ncbi:MAG: hypothetical protein EOP06_08915 [Proteobacteria bacterium]|nr:MAG: hypothetical protein EOP06_08915 [Pseudomonadota bacterium]
MLRTPTYSSLVSILRLLMLAACILVVGFLCGMSFSGGTDDGRRDRGRLQGTQHRNTSASNQNNEQTHMHTCQHLSTLEISGAPFRSHAITLVTNSGFRRLTKNFLSWAARVHPPLPHLIFRALDVDELIWLQSLNQTVKYDARLDFGGAASNFRESAYNNIVMQKWHFALESLEHGNDTLLIDPDIVLFQNPFLHFVCVLSCKISVLMHCCAHGGRSRFCARETSPKCRNTYRSVMSTSPTIPQFHSI